jgi:hypothetical protein
VNMGADRVLTLRELNRATLARQMLLDRETFLVDDFVGGLWKVKETRKAARLVIEPFGPCQRATATPSSGRERGSFASSETAWRPSRSDSRRGSEGQPGCSAC